MARLRLFAGGPAGGRFGGWTRHNETYKVLLLNWEEEKRKSWVKQRKICWIIRAGPTGLTFPGVNWPSTRIAALDEAFQERKDKIKLLGHRASEAGIETITSLEDMVPLLFPHTAYKSYPESFLSEQRWDRLSKWLGTVSPYAIAALDMEKIADIDDWIDQLQAQGNYISCSSGTTGKSAMLIASEKDMDWSRVDTVNVFAWGSGVEPKADRKLIGCAPVATVPKNQIIGAAQYAAFANPEWPRWNYPVPPITVGALTSMVVMRKKIADGTATPR